MKLSNQVHKDLGRLAVKRVDEAISSVTQLVDDDMQLLHLIMFVCSSLVGASAEHMTNTIKTKDGKKIPREEAFMRVLSGIGELHGVNSRMITEEEAIALGIETRRKKP